MAASATNQFQEKLEELPSIIRIAFETQAKARITVEKLDAQFAKLSAHLALQEDDDSDNFIIEDDLALIKLETKIERLKLELTEAEDKAEMEFRASETKVTEAYVKAFLGINPAVTSLRHKVLDAKEAARIRKVTLQRERQAARLIKQHEIFATKINTEPKDDKLSALREKLAEANEELILADAEVEIVLASLETYKMLTQLNRQVSWG